MYTRVGLLSLLVASLLLADPSAAEAAFIVLDNDPAAGPGSQDGTVVFSAGWQTSTSNPLHWDQNYHHNQNQPGRLVTYTPDLPSAGAWRVDAWWTSDANRAAAAPFTINYDGSSVTIPVNQQSAGGQWNTLGTYTFAAGTGGNVEIGSAPSGYVIADAVRFTRQGTGTLATLLPATDALASSSNSNRPATNVINNSGMTDGNADGLLDTHSVNAYGEGINWMTDSLTVDTDPWIMADLGQVAAVSEMYVWNFNAESGRTDRGVGLADIYISQQAAPGSDFSNAGEWTRLYDDYGFSQAPGTAGYDTPDVVDMLGSDARWVALDIESTQGSTSFVGLSELQFFGVADVPPNPVIIIDDGPTSAPNTQDITWSDLADWNYRGETGPSNKPNSYNATGSRFAFANAGATATYAPDLPFGGIWRVDMWWPTFGWSSNVPVTVDHLQGTSAFPIDQSANSGQWNYLGVFDFGDGRDGSVAITSIGSTPGASNTGPVADAMRFTYLGLEPLDVFARALGVRVSSTHPINDRRPGENVINGSGMTDEDGDGIPDTHDTSSYGDYLSWMTDSFTNDPDPWLMVDMGYTMTVSHMDIWNFNATGGNTDRGVGLADFYISVAEDPSSDFSNPAEWMLLLEDVALGEAPGTAGYDTPTMVDLLDTPARWIAIDILENLGDPSFVGLSEIMVYQHLQSTIPEPATLSLLGLGLLAVARRRRRR